MCGICGVVKHRAEPLLKTVRAMVHAQKHRGPDGQGIYLAADNPLVSYDSAPEDTRPARCGLGHSRLAILDPEGGAQPMVSDDRQIAVLLNGEIYNFLAIREELRKEGRTFRTDTDTEVLIHLYEREPENPGRWLRELNGIFSIALWDNRKQRLFLARDHFGVKPLHYWERDGTFIFASEIKAILAAGVKPGLDRASLHLFLNIRYVPTDQTLFEDISRLSPGHFLTVKDGRIRSRERFYSLPESSRGHAGEGRRHVQEQVRSCFYEAVKRQLLSDVPVGAALSGGLDSSMIVAAATDSYRRAPGLRSGDGILRTFTLGFNEPTDENEDAAAVAEHFRTRHYDTSLSANPLDDAMDVIRAVEEPKINILQGYALARFIRPHVKVVLGGLGGDELFAGYDIHRYCNVLGRLHPFAPAPLRSVLLGPVSRLLWNLQYRSEALKVEYYRIGAQIALSLGDRAQFYCRLRNAWDFDRAMYERVYSRPDHFRQFPTTDEVFRPYFPPDGNYLEQVLRAEFHTKMVNDFLVNEDRVLSAHGIEGRVPFLDRDLVELAFRIPVSWKMSGSATKDFWKKSVGRVLPERILNKKKQGFTFSSYHQWGKDLRGMVERELTPQWCGDTGLFNHRFIQSVLDYDPHPNLRWHYFMAWMMLGVKKWMEAFHVEV